MNRFRLLVPMAAMAAMLLLACGGGDNPVRRWPSAPTGGGTGAVVVQATGGSFFGFEVTLTHDAAVMTPRTPLDTWSHGSGVAAGSTCAAEQQGATLHLACASATAMSGPAEIATFGFAYSYQAPDAGDFTATCSFVDGNGRPVAVGCTATYVR